MWKIYRRITSRYPIISLDEERQLIAQAKGRSKEKKEEFVLRHVGFIIFRIYKKTFPSYVTRYGEDILSEAVLFCMIRLKPTTWSIKTSRVILSRLDFLLIFGKGSMGSSLIW